jgi:serine protease AprX
MTSSFRTVDRMRWMSALAAIVLALVYSLALSGAHQLPSLPSSFSAHAITHAGGSSAPLDPRIATLAAAHPNAQLEAIVQFKPGLSLGRARADALRAGGRVYGTLRIINGLAVTMSAAEAQHLAAGPDVHSVSLNTQITSQGGPMLDHARGLAARQLQTTYDQTLGVTGLWRHGATGAGVGVAVVDTGIDGNLPDFRSRDGDSRVIGSAVTNPAATTAVDSYGHGTDVAGIIAGNGGHTRYVGVAPGANLISIKASDEAGRATVLDVIYGIQFAVDHQRDYNIRVLNLSLDSATPQSYKTDPLDAAVESAWMRGIVVVAAAGNRGQADDAVQYAPGNDPYAITVGAVDENGSPNPLGDTIASWSSRGVTQDGVTKPDVYAPGAHIVSVLAPGSYFAKECPTCVVLGRYIRTSGTSMATPMISGLVADLLQAHPDLTPDQVKGALTNRDVSSNPSFQEPDAVRTASALDSPLANQGLTPNQFVGPDGNVNYSMGSWSMGSWSMGSWSVAQGDLVAPFAMSSWSCASCTGGGGVDPSMGSWSMGSWSTMQDG